MNQSNNPYEQYDYDHYDQPPRSGAHGRGLVEKVFGPAFAMKLRNPLFATAALLLVGAAFAGIIVASYPKASNNQDVPVIKAETTAFKEVPDDRGGMDVPHRDSTIFMSMGESGMQERPPVENLLEQEEPLSTAEAFASEQEAVDMTGSSASATEPASGEEAKPAVETETSTNEMATPAPEKVVGVPEAKPKVEVQKIIAEEQEKELPQDLIAETEAQVEKPQKKLHAPASSPETIAFVRSVLDKKDDATTTTTTTGGVTTQKVAKAQEQNIAAVMEKIEPSSGAALSSGPAIAAGTYFIQLGSVKTEDGAAAEWAKIQKSFASDLKGLEYRVQRAELGDRGTFYRIQAGPMSKDSANSVCDSIKAQKPGGCLVVQ